jgi:hypothetical protein
MFDILASAWQATLREDGAVRLSLAKIGDIMAEMLRGGPGDVLYDRV